ncbi:MAG: UDP-N-acetylmuramoyl-L-alanyl-D-glutamate--2,6-diaminopimelate ligase [Mycobacteriales bacterium]
MPTPHMPRPSGLPPTPLAKLAELLGERLDSGAAADYSADATVTGVAQASSSVLPGDLYVALPGARTHGAGFGADAAVRGAAAVLTDPAGARLLAGDGVELPALVVRDPRQVVGAVAAAVYHRPSSKLRVVGITGTNGKTTTAHLVDAILTGLGETTALLGTVHTRIGEQLLPSTRTTPEAAELQALLAVAAERGVDVVTMEVSSHALAMDRVEGTRFAVGAFTNLSVDHLDFHANLEEYFAAKARLFDGRVEHELVTIDDEAGRRLVKPGTVTVSIDGAAPIDGAVSAAWRASEIRRDGYGQRFRLHAPDGSSGEACVALPGRFNVSNGLLAVAAVVTLGAPLPDAIAQLSRVPGVPGRMERVGAAGEHPIELPITAVVDYAHTPDGVTKALAALRGTTTGRLICVLGCGGDRDVGKRPLIGAAAASGADLFIATDDNPRSEAPSAIRAAMLSGARAAPGAPDVVEIADRAGAIEYAVRAAAPGDTVAVLGKGHEQGQETAGVKTPFDDRKVVAQALLRVYG